MKNLMSIKAGLVALIAMLSVSCASEYKNVTGKRANYTSMSSEELAEHLIFKDKGFKLNQKIQEGGTVRSRMEQDDIQKTCSALKGHQVNSSTAQKVSTIARNTMRYPKDGIRLGDWKKGRAIAQNAFGFRVGHKTDKHGKRKPGGMCVNCHLLDSEMTIPSGNLGPSLRGYGKMRGQSKAVKKYTYEVIYNPHSTFPCTDMPRLGANGFINQKQIRDVMAYLLDPQSPINK